MARYATYNVKKNIQTKIGLFPPEIFLIERFLRNYKKKLWCSLMESDFRSFVFLLLSKQHPFRKFISIFWHFSNGISHSVKRNLKINFSFFKTRTQDEIIPSQKRIEASKYIKCFMQKYSLCIILCTHNRQEILTPIVPCLKFKKHPNDDGWFRRATKVM